MPKLKTTKAHCNGCGHDTNHLVLASRQINGGTFVEDYGDIHWADKYEMLECAGCERVCLRHTYWFEPTDETDVTLFPPPVTRRPPSWQSSLPSRVQQLLKEVYSALAADSRSLALMGARGLVDMVLFEHVGDVGNFPQKLLEAEKAGLITKKSGEILRVALDAGNAAAHRGYRASSENVAAVMDIVENLLQAVYHLESLAANLKETTPPRKPKQ